MWPVLLLSGTAFCKLWIENIKHDFKSSSFLECCYKFSLLNKIHLFYNLKFRLFVKCLFSPNAKISLHLHYKEAIKKNTRKQWDQLAITQGSPASKRKARKDCLAVKEIALFNICPRGLSDLASDHQDRFKYDLEKLLRIPILVTRQLSEWLFKLVIDIRIVGKY